MKPLFTKALTYRRRAPWGVWRLSFADAMCYACMVTVAESLSSAYLARHVSSMSAYGIMMTLPTTVGAIFQAAVPQILRRVSLPTLTLAAVVLQIIGLLLMGLALAKATLSYPDMLLGLCFYWIGGLNAGAPWQEWLSKIIPSPDQNRFFSRRASLISLVTLMFYLGVAWAISGHLDAATMASLLFVAAGLRLASGIFLWLHPRPKLTLPFPPHEVPVAVETVSTPALGYSIMALCVLNFAFRLSVNISSPFYSPYMLNELNMSIMMYAWMTALPFLARVVALYNWGRLLDDKGMFEGVLISILLVSILPVLWTLGDNAWYIGALQVGSGIGWSGFELLTTLFVQYVFPHKIMRSLALFLAAGSLGGVAGGILGGQLLDAGGGYSVIFIGSGALRFVTGFLFLWYLRRCQAFSFRELRVRYSMWVVFSVRHPSHALLRRLQGRRARPSPEVPKDDAAA